jgi:hypothetical protein
MSKEFLTIRCSADILEAIQQQMNATGRGKTEIVEGLLRQALGLAEPTTAEAAGLPLDERIEAIIAEKTEFIARQTNDLVQQNNGAVQQVQQLVQLLKERVEALEKLEA